MTRRWLECTQRCFHWELWESSILDIVVHTRFWRGLVPTLMSSIFPMILEPAGYSASRIWLVITLSRDHIGFQFVHCCHYYWGDPPLRSLCIPSQFDFIIHASPFASGEFFEAEENWWELVGVICLVICLGYFSCLFRLGSVLFLCFSPMLDMWENFFCVGPL